jgi:hypothetical protein
MYIRPKSVSEHNNIAKCVSASRILRNICTLDQKLCQNTQNSEMCVCKQNSSRTYVHYTKICVRTNKTTKRVSGNKILAERVYIRPKSVSERHDIGKCVSESRIPAECIYIKLQSVPERNKIAKFVSAS